MEKGVKTVAWIFVFPALLIGCLGSETIVKPTGDEKERIHSETIVYVVLKDSTKYEFDVPPAIVRDEIVGKVNGKQLSIPVSDVAVVCVNRISFLTNVALSAIFGLAVAVPIVLIGTLVSAIDR